MLLLRSNGYSNPIFCIRKKNSVRHDMSLKLIKRQNFSFYLLFLFSTSQMMFIFQRKKEKREDKLEDTLRQVSRLKTRKHHICLDSKYFVKFLTFTGSVRHEYIQYLKSDQYFDMYKSNMFNIWKKYDLEEAIHHQHWELHYK